MSKEFDVVIYHGGCPDGIGSAWAAKRYLGDRAIYIPMTHEQPLPRTVIKGKRVVLFDFCFKRPVLEEAMRICKEVVVIDHHLGNMKDCGDLPNCHFDLDHSGAVLAWKFFFPDEDTPLILRYIEDRDLWRWKMPDAREYLATFDSYDLTTETVEQFLKFNPREVINRGEPVIKYRDQVVGRLAATGRRCSFGYPDLYDGVVGVCNVNSPNFMSDVCHRMFEQLDVDVAACWFFDYSADYVPGIYRVSLRSRTGCDVNVSEIAKEFNGGGHKHAAGFELEADVHDILDVFVCPPLDT